MSRWCFAVIALLLIAVRTPAVAAAPSFAEFDAKAQAGEKLTVVFFGASLTWGANATDPQLTSFRGQIADRLIAKYPKAHFKFYDAAIGGTSSQLGIFRLDRDVLRRKPDLVFVDFSANDGIDNPNKETLASYEAIVRRIVTETKVPVVQVIFPFKWNVMSGSTKGMVRLEAHHAISKAYNTAIGDAIQLAQARVKAKETTVDELWPDDGVHPGDKGYKLFADAGWDAFEKAVEAKQVCAAPEKMVNADTYMNTARVRISSLGTLPEGWKVGRPFVVSAFFDMLMSRWLDDLVITSAKKKTEKSAAVKEPSRLRVNFTGSQVQLFGESTPNSAKYRCYIDGKLVERKDGKGQPIAPEFDAGHLGKILRGNCHHAQVIAEGLDADKPHTLEIEPVWTGDADQEIRLESICVAGGKPRVWVEGSKE